MSPTYLSKSRPCGFAKSVFVQPSSAALLFIASTNAAWAALSAPPSEPPTASAIAIAASFPDEVRSAFSASSSVSTSPSLSAADDSPIVAASLLTVIFVSSEAFSSATMAVMILVTDAICVCVSASRSKYTVPSSSTT